MASTSYDKTGDEDEYSVETILDHKRYKELIAKGLRQEGLEYKPNQRLFLIKWEGWDDPNDLTWEPRENINHLDLFLQYIKAHNLPFTDEGDEKDIITLKRKSSSENGVAEPKKLKSDQIFEDEEKRKRKEQLRHEKEACRLALEEEERRIRKEKKRKKRMERETFEQLQAEEEFKKRQHEFEREEARREHKEAKLSGAEEEESKEQALATVKKDEKEKPSSKSFKQLSDSSELSATDEEWNQPSTSTTTKPPTTIHKSIKPTPNDESTSSKNLKPVTIDLEEAERKRKRKEERRLRKEMERAKLLATEEDEQLLVKTLNKANIGREATKPNKVETDELRIVNKVVSDQEHLKSKVSSESKETSERTKEASSSSSKLVEEIPKKPKEKFEMAPSSSKPLDEPIKKQKEKPEKPQSAPTFIDIFSSEPGTSTNNLVNGTKEKTKFKIPKKEKPGISASSSTTKLEVKNGAKPTIRSFRIPKKLDPDEDPVLKFKRMISVISNGLIAKLNCTDDEDERLQASMRIFIDNYTWLNKQVKSMLLFTY
uniref:Chromo domain-containing protein n=1 Tax=Acrobeloides nanus TaxID=290746 RepID=A0A914CPY3_9BILA